VIRPTPTSSAFVAALLAVSLSACDSSTGVAPGLGGSLNCGQQYTSPDAPLGLALPFKEWTTWGVGGVGYFYGEGTHTGNDFYATDWNCCGYADEGKPIYPVAAGRVVAIHHWTGSASGDPLGNYVEVEHPGSPPFKSRYAHLKAFALDDQDVGRPVFTTTQIGELGTTGNSTGPHLHLSFKRWSDAEGDWISRKNDPGSPKPSPMWTTRGLIDVCDGDSLTVKKPVSVFRDVDPTNTYSPHIESLYAHGFVIGCNNDPYEFCPFETLTRAEMAVVIVRAYHDEHYAYEPPQPQEQHFDDVLLGIWYARWVHQLWVDGFTDGCTLDGRYFCPDRLVTKLELAVFLLRARHGTDYQPPPAQGIFADVDEGSWGPEWAEAAYNQGIMDACAVSPRRFCPDHQVNRRVMAVYMVAGFDLPLPPEPEDPPLPP
jgi:hypothetical protein